MNKPAAVSLIILLILGSNYVQDRARLNALIQNVGWFFGITLKSCILYGLQEIRKWICGAESSGFVDGFPLDINLNDENPIIFEGSGIGNWIAHVIIRTMKDYHKLCKENVRGGCCCGRNGRNCCCYC
ncbi:hypothetical protein VPH35_090120 [Triticum aestivum]